MTDLSFLIGYKGVGRALAQLGILEKGHNRSVGKMRRGFQGLGKSLKGATAQIPGMGQAFAMLSNPIAIGGAAIAGFVAFATKAIKVNADFTESISKLGSITGATGKDLEFFRKASIEMGRTSTKTASQVADAFTIVGSKKPELLATSEALRDVTKDAITLAEAASIDVPASATALTTALNQFSLPGRESGRVMNALAAESKLSAATIPQAAAALEKFGTIADGANVSIEASLGLIGTLAEKGIAGSEAGTQLRGVFATLQKDQSLYNNGVFDLNFALEKLAKKGLTNSDIFEKFGKINATTAKILIENRGRFAELTDAVTGTNTATEQAAKNVDNLNGDLKALSSAIESKFITAGSKMDGTIRGIVQALTDLINESDHAAKKFDGLFKVLGKGLDIIVGLVDGLGNITDKLGLTNESLSVGEKRAEKFGLALKASMGFGLQLIDTLTKLPAAIAKIKLELMNFVAFVETSLDVRIFTKPEQAAKAGIKSTNNFKAAIQDFTKTTNSSKGELSGFLRTLKDMETAGKSQAVIMADLRKRWDEYKNGVKGANDDFVAPKKGPKIEGDFSDFFAIGTADQEQEALAGYIEDLGEVQNHIVNIKEVIGEIKEFGGLSLGVDAAGDLTDLYMVEEALHAVKKASLNAFGSMAEALGRAAAGLGTATGAIQAFVQTLLVEGPKVLGFALLNAAAFPGNAAIALPLAIAGAGLLALSGFIGGLFDAKNENAGALPSVAPSQPSTPAPTSVGLGSVGAASGVVVNVTNQLDGEDLAANISVTLLDLKERSTG